MFDEKMEPLIENVVIKGHSVMGISLKGEKVKTMIIQVYMPDINVTKKEILLTYQEVEKTKNELCCRNRDQIIIMGDFNARIGKDRVDRVTGDFLVDETNRNERILIDFCREHNLVLRNTFKPIKKKRIFSWKGDHGHGQSLIDFIAVNNRDKKCVRKCKVVHRVDKLSDHFPVVAILKLKKPRMIRKTMLAQHDREWLNDPANRKSFEEYVFLQQRESDERNWQDIERRIKEAEKDVIPKRRRSKRNNWMTDEILDLMETRKIKKNPNETRIIRQRCRSAKEKEVQESP